MPILRHTAEANIKLGMVGGIRMGSDAGVLVDGDLTSATAAKAAVDSDVAKLHTAEKLVGIRVKASIDQADNYLSGATTGSSVANIIAVEPTARGRALRL